MIGADSKGMMIANVPVVFLGNRIAHRLPVRATRIVASLLFLGLSSTAFYASEMSLADLWASFMVTAENFWGSHVN